MFLRKTSFAIAVCFGVLFVYAGPVVAQSIPNLFSIGVMPDAPNELDEVVFKQVFLSSGVDHEVGAIEWTFLDPFHVQVITLIVAPDPSGDPVPGDIRALEVESELGLLPAGEYQYSSTAVVFSRYEFPDTPAHIETAFDHLALVGPLWTGSFTVSPEPLRGDVDGDGDIDDTDLGIAISNFTGNGGAPSSLPGDTDGDGDVDDTDLGVMISGFTGPLSPVAVPEPASVVLLVFASGLTLVRSRRLE